jgi:hypothetical protein
VKSAEVSLDRARFFVFFSVFLFFYFRDFLCFFLVFCCFFLFFRVLCCFLGWVSCCGSFFVGPAFRVFVFFLVFPYGNFFVFWFFWPFLALFLFFFVGKLVFPFFVSGGGSFLPSARGSRPFFR